MGVDLSALIAEPAARPAAPTPPTAPTGGEAAMPELSLGAVSLKIGKLQVSGFAESEVPLPDFETGIAASGGGWTFSPEGDAPALSADPHSLVLTGVRVSPPPRSADPPFTADRIEAAVRPEALANEKVIDLLAAANPSVHLSPAALAPYGIDLNAAARAGGSEGEVEGGSDPAPAPPADSGAPIWEGVAFGALAIENGRVEVAGFAPPVPSSSFGFSARREGDLYHAEITDLSLSAADGRKPFATAKTITLEADADASLWEERRLKRIACDLLTADSVGISDFYAAATGALAEPETIPAPSPPPDLPEDMRGGPPRKKVWVAEEFEIEHAQMRVSEIAPGIPEVIFSASASEKDIPLTPEGIAESTGQRRVELSGIRIKGIYNPTLPVADLDTIFVYYSFAGLMKEKIDKIELVNPTIYVGEPLFWYIDYFRNYWSADVAADPKPDDGSGAERIPVPEGGWDVGKLEAYSGKLVIAPKGYPIKSVPFPFPFNASTELNSGKIEATLRVPPGTYGWEDLKLEILDLRGEIQFNLPIKQADNNLVETLHADEVRFRQFRFQEVFLSVTYDKDGIYGTFGGEAYSGYLNGGFNFYLDDASSWDAWTAGTGVMMEPITQALFPEYLMMTGKADFTVIGVGDIGGVNQLDGKFEAKTPGVLDITGIDELREQIPDGWTQLEESLTQIGMQAFRRFEFETATGSFRLYGREGEVHCDLHGPSGRWRADVTAHDHRSPEIILSE
ncbi:MAG: hypothetical protein R3F11_28095 [Verrucomicrobiales bacterium]